MQGTASRNDINIRSSRYFLARTMGTCRYCRSHTQLIALAVPSGHEALELDDEERDEELAVDTWRVAPHSAFLFHVEFIPAVIQDRLKQFPSYRIGNSEAGVGVYWANHCEQCGSQLDDEELFCEPEGAFLPTSESAASAIHLLALEEAFEAAAAGYAPEPQFFDAMSED